MLRPHTGHSGMFDKRSRFLRCRPIVRRCWRCLDWLCLCGRARPEGCCFPRYSLGQEAGPRVLSRLSRAIRLDWFGPMVLGRLAAPWLAGLTLAG